MATITAQSILNRAATILQDTTNTRWPEDELLDWLNDGQREVVLYKPDANPKLEELSLDIGTRQSIPPHGLQFLDAVRNVVNGIPSTAIRLIERRVLDEQVPDWHSESGSTIVKHFLFDERDPKHFWVYPPSDGSAKVEVLFSSAPVDIAKTDTIGIDDIYANALLDYILYRAYLKDADYAANDNRATSQHQRFLSSLGMLDAQEATNNPYVRKKNPVVPPGGE
jgi:hypothetical protein